jgi:hypothetical protein
MFYHPNNYQRKVWSLIKKIDSFDIKSILYTDNSYTNMLIDEASKLNLYDSSIDMIFFAETCRPNLIPCTNGRNSNDDQHVIRHLQLGHTSKGPVINEKQHEVFLEALVSYQNRELQDLLENHFGLQDTFKRTMNGYSQQNFRKLYSTPKPVVKMKPNKLLAS